MTRQQYENHFHSVPGAWWGTFLRGSMLITVEAAKTGEAIAYITGYGFKVVGAEVSKQDSAGIKLRVK